MQSMLFVKPPGLPGQAWHQDESHIPTRDHDRRDEYDLSDEAYGFDDGTELAVELEAGSVLFFNGYLLHRSRRNRSAGYRRALVNHYMSMSSALPWEAAEDEIKAGRLSVARADFRGVVPVCGSDPAAGRGYLEPRGVWIRGYDAAAVRNG